MSTDTEPLMHLTFAGEITAACGQEIDGTRHTGLWAESIQQEAEGNPSQVCAACAALARGDAPKPETYSSDLERSFDAGIRKCLATFTEHAEAFKAAGAIDVALTVLTVTNGVSLQLLGEERS